MRKTSKVLFMTVMLASLLIAAACEKNPETVAKKLRAERVERGEYLVTVGGCNDCHTPYKMGEHGPEPDMSRMLSGHPESFAISEAPRFDSPEWMWAGSPTNTAFAGPWGVTFAANLTPDKETGIGTWTEETFIKTIRSGKHWGVDRPILPPMPWQNYARMTDEDLIAIYTYLQSIPPQQNAVPRVIPPAPVRTAGAQPAQEPL